MWNTCLDEIVLIGEFVKYVGLYTWIAIVDMFVHVTDVNV